MLLALLRRFRQFPWARFNGHPPLGVNATVENGDWARAERALGFQRAPTLGGECYIRATEAQLDAAQYRRFNGHPPLGVNATQRAGATLARA